MCNFFNKLKKVFLNFFYKDSELKNNQFHPYETLTFPIMRHYYPKLISKQLVDVMPIDKPDVVKAFMRIKRDPIKQLEEASHIKKMNEKEIEEHIKNIYEVFKNS